MKKVSDWHFYFFFAIIRSIAGLSMKSYLIPDEYWQSTEVAHHFVFGNGYLTWEWNKDHPIRSPVYPSIFIIWFKLLKNLSLDYPLIIAHSPRILQAFFSAFIDFFILKFCRKRLGDKCLFLTAFVLLFNWFFMCHFARTIINCFEAFLFSGYLFYKETDVKLQHYPMRNNFKEFFIVVFLICLRPTTLITLSSFWSVDLLFLTFYGKDSIMKNFAKSFYEGLIIIMTVILGLTIAGFFDYLFFGKFVLTSWEFIKVNFFEGIASRYGISGFFSYFYQYFFVIMTIYSFPFMFGVWKSCQKKNIFDILFLIKNVLNILILSCSAHKEARFLMMNLPFFVYFTVKGLILIKRNLKNLILLSSVLLNVALFIYFSFIHKIGSANLMNYLQNKSFNSLLLLTQCHQTPLHSYLHKENLIIRFPDCSKHEKNCENELLFDTKNSFRLVQRIINEKKYEYLVTYDKIFTIDPNIKYLIEKNNYKLENIIYHSSSQEVGNIELNDVNYLVYKKII